MDALDDACEIIEEKTGCSSCWSMEIMAWKMKCKSGAQSGDLADSDDMDAVNACERGKDSEQTRGFVGNGTSIRPHTQAAPILTRILPLLINSLSLPSYILYIHIISIFFIKYIKGK
jgi:hypothetical protein